MRLYHFVNAKHGLDNISQRRLKIAKLDELNDPFEVLGINLSNPVNRRQLLDYKWELATQVGILCLSATWRNPLLWSHYADRHRGLALGFDVSGDRFRPVNYVRTRKPWPAELDGRFQEELLYTKFSHWWYEREYRATVRLSRAVRGVQFAPFSKEMQLAQVIVGPHSEVTRADVDSALGNLVARVQRFKARAAFKSFRVVQNQKAYLWI